MVWTRDSYRMCRGDFLGKVRVNAEIIENYYRTALRRDKVVMLGCELFWLWIISDRISRSASSGFDIAVRCYLVGSLTLIWCPSSTRRRAFRQKDAFDECKITQHYLIVDYILGNCCGENFIYSSSILPAETK
jgi:hypothetical protein